MTNYNRFPLSQHAHPWLFLQLTVAGSRRRFESDGFAKCVLELSTVSCILFCGTGLVSGAVPDPMQSAAPPLPSNEGVHADKQRGLDQVSP